MGHFPHFPDGEAETENRSHPCWKPHSSEYQSQNSNLDIVTKALGTRQKEESTSLIADQEYLSRNSLRQLLTPPTFVTNAWEGLTVHSL